MPRITVENVELGEIKANDEFNDMQSRATKDVIVRKINSIPEYQ